MKVALIFPPYTHKIFSENLSTVDEEFCLAPPLILAYVAAILEEAGHKVILIDARALNLDKEEVLQILKVFGPDLIGFRSETYHFHDALAWVGYFKEQLKVPTFTGGINLSLYPEETLSHKEIDYGIIGEALYSLPNFLKLLENGDNLSLAPGLAYKDKEGRVVKNAPSPERINLDDYPFPARHLLQNDRYYSFISQLKNFTIMITSTGCPYRCSFCAIHPNTQYRVRSWKNVVDEIEVCYKDFSIREFDFFDAVLFLGKERVLKIFSEIRRRGLEIEWSCRSRVDTVDEEILREASKAGCRQIYYGIESVDHGVLTKVKKDIKLEQIIRAIGWSKNYGIRAMGFFMVGNPGDTRKSIRSTIRFAKNLDLDFIQVCRTIAKPGTDLDKAMIEKSGRDFWREHIAGKKIEGRLPTPWSGLSEAEIENLTKEFYLKFYFRPKILWKRLMQLKTLGELRRYVKVAMKMFLQKSELGLRILTDTSEAKEFLILSEEYLTEMKEFRVALIIPTLNERDNIVGLFQAVRGILPKAQIVIVDDNSPDGTGKVSDDLASRDKLVHVLHRRGKRGLGLAYKEAFTYVLNNLDSEYIFEMDADFSHNPRYLALFLYYAREFPIVTGSRFLKKVSIQDRTVWRNIISVSSKAMVNLMLGLNLTDVTTGFKCFNRMALQDIDLTQVRSRGFVFQMEIAYMAQRRGMRVKEIPILFVERKAGKSKMRPKTVLEGICILLYLVFCRITGRR